SEKRTTPRVLLDSAGTRRSPRRGRRFPRPPLRPPRPPPRIPSPPPTLARLATGHSYRVPAMARPTTRPKFPARPLRSRRSTIGGLHRGGLEHLPSHPRRQSVAPPAGPHRGSEHPDNESASESALFITQFAVNKA